MKLYKFLNADGSPAHGGSGSWSLPTADGPGEWMPRIDGFVMCERGYHLCRPGDLVYWCAPALYEVELDAASEVLEENSGETKLCVSGPVRLIRRVETWNARTARLFACDCAERVLPIFERAMPDDKRPRDAIDVVRRYAAGDATEEELAAVSAASAAASDATWDAVSAASAAAWAAVSAASAAASAAAWAAARAARAAASDAARAAARAASAAASDADRCWQAQRLQWYLDGEKGGT